MSSSQQRASLILQVRAGQLTALEAARQLGISRQSFYKWEKRGLKALLESLEDQPKGRPPTPTDPEKEQLRDRVEELERKVRLYEQREKLRLMIQQMEEPGRPGSSTKKNSR